MNFPSSLSAFRRPRVEGRLPATERRGELAIAKARPESHRIQDLDTTGARGQRSALALPEARPAAAKQEFRREDTNQDGSMDPQELLALLKDQALVLSLLEQFDADGDGRLDPSEWKAALAHLTPSTGQAPGAPTAPSGAAPSAGSQGAPSGGSSGGTSAPTGSASRQVGDKSAAVQQAIAAIRQDPAINQAFANWDNLSPQQKIEVGHRISEKLGSAFGFAPAANLRHDPSLDGTGTLGLWNSEGIALSSEALADPAQFLDTMVHEQMHHLDASDGVQDMIDPAHNTGTVQDEVYLIGHAVSEGVFGAHAA